MKYIKSTDGSVYRIDSECVKTYCYDEVEWKNILVLREATQSESDIVNKNQRLKPYAGDDKHPIIKEIFNSGILEKAVEDSMIKRQSLFNKLDVEQDMLFKLLIEFEDAVYCSAGNNYHQNKAAMKRAKKAKRSIISLFSSLTQREISATKKEKS